MEVAHCGNGLWCSLAFYELFLRSEHFAAISLSYLAKEASPQSQDIEDLTAYLTRFLGGANAAMAVLAFVWVRVRRKQRRSGMSQGWDPTVAFLLPVDRMLLLVFAVFHFTQLCGHVYLWRTGRPIFVPMGSLMQKICLGDTIFCLLNLVGLCKSLQ